MDDRTIAPRLSSSARVQFVIVTAIWGSTWLVITAQIGTVPPSWSVAYRFLLGGSVMLALCLAAGRSLRLGAAGHGFALAIALLQFGLNFNFVYRAEQHLTSGLVAVVFALLVVPNAILARLFLGSRVTPRFAGGAALGIAGVLLMFGPDLLQPVEHAEALSGVVLVVLGVLSASAANVLQATALGRRLPLEGTLAVAMLYGGLLDAAVAFGLTGAPVFDASPRYVAGLVYLAVAASALAFTLYYQLIRAIGPARAAYSSVVIPVVALTLSTVFEGYRWTWAAAVGATLALAGLVIALRSRA